MYNIRDFISHCVGWLVGLSVCLSHFACPSHFVFLGGFLGHLEVRKLKSKSFMSYKQRSQLYKSPCWSVGQFVHPSHFVGQSVTLCFLCVFGPFRGRETHIKVIHEL